MADTDFSPEEQAYIQQDRASAAQSALAIGVHSNPDLEAEAQRLAATTGLPQSSVAAFPKQVQQRQNLLGIDYQALARDTPHTANFFSNVQNAKIAHDDIPSLTQMEKLLQPALTSYTQSLGEQVTDWWKGLFGVPQREQARAMNVYARGGMNQFLRGTPADMTAAQERESIGGMSEIPSQLVSTTANVASLRLVPNTEGEAETTAGQIASAGGALAGFLYGGPMALGKLAVGEGIPIAANASRMKAILASVLNQGATLGVASGAAALGSAVNAPDVETAANTLANATAGGAVTGAVFGAAGRLFPGNTVLQAAARFAAITGGLDAASGTSPVETFANWQKMTDAEKVDKLFNYGLNAFFSLKGEPTGGSWFKDAITDAHNTAGMAETAANLSSRITALSQAAADSKLRGRSAESFKEAVGRMAENSDLEAVYVDGDKLAQAFHQSGMSMDALPQVAAQVAEAVQTRGTVRIPIEDYLTHIVGSPVDDAIRPELRASPDGMSVSEGQGFYDNQVEAIRAQANRVLAEKSTDDAFQADKQTVQDSIRDQLNAIKRFRPEVNEVYARIAAEHYAVAAGQEGRMPSEMLEQYPLHVAAENPAAGGFNQAGMEMPKKFTRASLERLAAADMGSPDKQDVGRWMDEQIRKQETEGKKIAEGCA